MATGTLTGQTIANTYKSLLKITGTTAGGETLHATNQIVIEDGDGNPFPFSAAQDAVLMTSTNRFEFGTNANYVYQVGSNVLGLVAGSEIDLTATAIDINGTADVSGTLTVDGTLTVNAAAVFNEASADVDFRVESNALTHMLFVDGGNNYIGVGTSAPDVRFHQKMDIATSANEGSSPDASLGGLALSLYSDTTTHAVLLDLKKSADNTLGGHATVADDEVIGQIQFRGSDGTTFESCAGISAYIDGSVTGSAMPGRLVFMTTPASNTLTPRMTILSGGNVGIGTDTPNTSLEIQEATGGRISLSTTDSGNNTIESGDALGYIQFRGNDTGISTSSYGCYIKGIAAGEWGTSDDDDDSPGELQFFTQDDSADDSTTSPRMIINRDGRVGIGTASPGVALDVEGVAGESVIIEVTAPASLDGDNETAKFISVATGGGSETTTEIGTRFHTSQHDTNKCLSYMVLTASDQTVNYLWVDDDDLLRGSTTPGHMGTTGGTAISASLSDERFKKISSDPFPYGLSEVNNLTPIKFTFKDRKSARDTLGFGAQTIRSIIPETVQDTGQCIHGYDSVKDESGNFIGIAKGDESETSLVMEYHQIIPVLVKAIQELSAKVTALENA